MDKEEIVRKRLIELLEGGNAHMTYGDAIQNFPMSKINDKFQNGTYSAWALLEHIGITQWDILDFIRNKNYKYMEWPKDYWPKEDKKASKSDWDKTIQGFRKDQKALIEIVKNLKTNLYSKIPWGEGQNILREILLVSDHNAYHIGEFSIMRQVMKTWGKNHK